MGNGKFSGNPQTEWLSDPGADRTMKMVAPFYYDDPEGRRWLAPKDATIDGASIPVALWSSVGSPYTGEYRRASIVHDVACGSADVIRKSANKMFYFACLEGGCSVAEARLLYAGVRIGAWTTAIRLWKSAAIGKPDINQEVDVVPLAERSIKNTFDEIAADMENMAPSTYEQIDNIVERHLNAKSVQLN